MKAEKLRRKAISKEIGKRFTGVSVAILISFSATGCGTRPAPQPVPTAPATAPVTVASGPQAASSSGAGSAVNNAANGSGSQAGSSDKINSDNPQQTRAVILEGASHSGPTVVVNVAPGATANFTLSDSKIITVGSPLKVRRVLLKFNKGTSQLKNRNFKTAAIALNFVILNEPDLAEAHNNYGIVLLHEGKKEQAEEEWRKAIALEPDNLVYQNNLARAMAGPGLVVLLQDARADDPDMLTDNAFEVENQGESEIYLYSGEGTYLDTLRNQYLTIRLPISEQDQDGSLPLVPQARPHVGLRHGSSITIETPKTNSSRFLIGNLIKAAGAQVQELDVVLTFSRSPSGKIETSTFQFLRNASPSRIHDLSLKIDLAK